MRHILTKVWCCSRRMSQIVLKWVNMFQKELHANVTKECFWRKDFWDQWYQPLPPAHVHRTHLFILLSQLQPPRQTFTLRHIWPLPCRCYGDHFVIWFFWMLRSSSANTIYRLYHLLHVIRLAIETLPSPSDSIRFIHLHSALWSVQEVAGMFCHGHTAWSSINPERRWVLWVIGVPTKP